MSTDKMDMNKLSQYDEHGYDSSICYVLYKLCYKYYKWMVSHHYELQDVVGNYICC
jgi:hypothetical protein